MAYVNVLGSTDTLLEKIRSARTQLLDIYRIIRRVRTLELMADIEREGYDIWPIDDDANALQTAACAALYNNILLSLLDGTAENWRYGYLIKPGRPVAFTDVTISVAGGGTKTLITANGGGPFAKCLCGASDDRITVSWIQSDGVKRTMTGLILDAVAADQLQLTTRINPELIINGSFSGDTDWTKGLGWTIVTEATATGAISTYLTSAATISVIAGREYELTYTITCSAGTIKVEFPYGYERAERSSSGTYTETFIAVNSATTTLRFVTNGFTGTVDNVTLTEKVPSADTSVEVELEATQV